jgi:hypothetical protein
MQNINLPSVITESLAKFRRNRIGNQPRVFVTIAPDTPDLRWGNQSIKEFVRLFLYESLTTGDPDAVIEVALRRKIELNDLNAFVGIHPSHWVQLRVSGRGLKIMESVVDELFAEVGYRCEEWVGVEDSNTQLGIFGATDNPELKMVFCLELSRQILKCDLLIPVCERFPLPRPITQEAKQSTLRT